ncbi:hypothetical protein [Chitinophaga varians]|uniref:hypothetical protein n=1 Tax=Chitinophaga varians TaxID=2202339 RepID=UPI00165F9D89|nr:hypothetical protein [Chitinophaga varians]MBC9915646.1 hypothetical protein [Chitinophaga varians]
MEKAGKNKPNGFLVAIRLLCLVAAVAMPFVWGRFMEGPTWYLIVAEVFLVTVILSVSHVLWKHSGTGEWKLHSSKKGITVHTLKVPGETWLKIKVTGKLWARLASILTLMRNPDAAEDVGMFDSYYLDGSDPRLVYYTFKQKLFPPFKHREFVVKSEFSQDPDTREMRFNFVAAPDKLPLNKKVFRITKMHNRWRYTPLESGGVEYEFIYDAVDPGGNFPYALANWLIPAMLPMAFTKMPKILYKEKYLNASVDYIQEVDLPEEAIAQRVEA